MESSTYSHVILLVLGLLFFAVSGFVGTKILTPESFGIYGHYRADAILEEANREIRHWTNRSCFSCHPYEAKIHLHGKHKTISCEFCHGPYADHVKGDKKIGTLPVKKGEDIKVLCLRCHNRTIQARPREVIKTVTMPEHLESQNVKLTHICNQCHHVHAPLKYINRAKKMLGMLKAG